MNDKNEMMGKNEKTTKKALIIASVASMLDNFNRSNIDILQELGYDVTVAANFHTKEDVNSQEKIDEFSEEMKEKGVHIVHIDFSRKVKNVKQQIKSIRQVKKLLTRRFNFIHCHSPICSVIIRAEAEKYRKEYGCRVIYTAHGFHFFTGAPIKNWLVFYPIEKLMSRYTDILITINQEDYKRAKRKLKANQTVYIPGVGVDTNKFSNGTVDVESKRRELGLHDEDIMILSVGELSVRKNHGVVMEALSMLSDSRVHYFIAGIGQRREEYINRAKELKMEKNIHLLGYRTDISELCQTADLYVFPSLQEGLPMALMEAIACRTPVLCSSIRGNTDLIRNENYLFDPSDANDLYNRLKGIIQGKDREKIEAENNNTVDANYEHLKQYDLCTVYDKMQIAYSGW